MQEVEAWEVLISIIIPVYNVESYLSECIESLLKQTEQRFEILLIDDGSKDSSGNMCDEYAEKNSRIRVFHQENRGVSAARNVGICNAFGKFICFVDSDDWVDEDYLQILVGHMEDGGMSVCDLTTGGQRVDKGGLLVLTKENAQVSVLSGKGMEGFPVTKMFDRNVLLKNKIFFDTDIALCEDVLFTMKYLEKTSGKIVWSKQSPYHYRKMSAGATNRRFQKHRNFTTKELTETDAIDRCKKYALNSKKVLKACKIRYTKAAVATLRTMVANDYNDEQLYKKLITYVRKYMFLYLFSPFSVKSSKISVLLCAFSPKLELAVWRKYVLSL